MRKRKWWIIGIAVVAFFGLAADSCQGRSQTQKDQQAAQNVEAEASARIQTNYEKNQPVPERPWSQLRQNLIELETAQTDTTSTTSFFFNQGVIDPVMSCPSVGFPIASTSQLTNPEQKIIESNSNNDHGNVTLPQIDPNGIFAGNSTGTYVMCLNAQGQVYANYWEGFVQTVTGPATWKTSTHSVELTGPPSFKFSKGKG